MANTQNRVLGIHNRAKCMAALEDGQPRTIKQIAQETGLPWRSVVYAFKCILEQNVPIYHRKISAHGERRSPQYFSTRPITDEVVEAIKSDVQRPTHPEAPPPRSLAQLVDQVSAEVRKERMLAPFRFPTRY